MLLTRDIAEVTVDVLLNLEKLQAARRGCLFEVVVGTPRKHATPKVEHSLLKGYPQTFTQFSQNAGVPRGNFRLPGESQWANKVGIPLWNRRMEGEPLQLGKAECASEQSSPPPTLTNGCVSYGDGRFLFPPLRSPLDSTARGSS